MSKQIQKKRTHPWDRLPNETDKAFHRFGIYLDLGPDRSLSKVSKRLGKSKGYEIFLAKWSSKHNWVARAGAYDEHLASQVIENKEEVIKSLRGSVLRRGEDIINNLFRIAEGVDPDRIEAIDRLLAIAGIETENNGSNDAPQGSVLQQFNQIIHNYHNEGSANGHNEGD